MRPRAAGLAVVRVLLVLGLVLGPAGCSQGSPEPTVVAPIAGTIRFASYDFPENQILVELYAEAARREGLLVSVQHGVGTREVVSPALQQGVVDVVIDYLGTALSFARPEAADLPRVPEEMHAVLQRTLGGRGVAVLQPARAEDQNGFAVTTAFSVEHGVIRLSELHPLAPSLTFGGPPECPQRPFCLRGLEETYGLEFGEVRAMPSRTATVEDLRSGQIDVGLLETTDARLAVAPVVLLIDDLGLQPPENVVPLVRTAAIDRWGEELRTALDGVSARLTTADLVELNAAVELQGKTAAEAAEQWWAGA